MEPGTSRSDPAVPSGPGAAADHAEALRAALVSIAISLLLLLAIALTV